MKHVFVSSSFSPVLGGVRFFYYYLFFGFGGQVLSQFPEVNPKKRIRTRVGVDPKKISKHFCDTFGNISFAGLVFGPQPGSRLIQILEGKPSGFIPIFHLGSPVLTMGNFSHVVE